MKYGETYESEVINTMTKESHGVWKFVYKRTEWNGWHTNNDGEGLWCGDKQMIGTCDFNVKGCKTEKAAKAKIRNYVKKNYEYYWEN